MANQVPNHFKYLLATKAIDFDNDSFIIILMESGFVFNKDTHALYADVSGNELPTANGYTIKNKALANVTVTEDDVNDRCDITTDAVSWTATDGAIGPCPGAIIIDDTVADDPIVGYIDFGAEYTQATGGTVTINNIAIRIS
jgi:hypothetical protein